MSRFRFVALDDRGISHRGILDATSAQSAVSALSSTYSLVTDVKELRGARMWSMVKGIFPERVSGEDLLGFTHELSSMLGAGLSLRESLEITASDTIKPHFSEIIEDVSRAVQQGVSLADAMRAHPRVFPLNYTSLVKAGENSGTLPSMLDRLAHQLELAEALASKVKGAFYYPTVVLAFAIFLAIGIVVVAVPMLKGIYSGLGRELPLPTQILMTVGTGVANHWMIALLSIVAMAFGVHRLFASAEGSYMLDNWRLRVPLLGSLLRNLAIARFSRNFGTVFSAGIPILQALELTAGTGGSPVLERSIRASIPRIEEGSALSAELRSGDFFTNLAIGMVSAGESCGNLDMMLEKVATFYEGRVENSLKALTSLVEPILMIGVGIMLGGLILSLGLPFLGLGTAIQ